MYADCVMRRVCVSCVWMKDGEGAKELESLHSEKLKVVELDVCSEEQVSQALRFVTANLDEPEKGEGGEFKGHSGRPDRPPRWKMRTVILYIVT